MIKKIAVLLVVCFALNKSVSAQIKLDDILGKAQELLKSKQLLTVKRGFSPVFSLGNLQLNKVGILGEKLKGVNVLGTIFESKAVQDITKLYKTYKTGLIVYKVLSGAGTVIAAYSTVRGVAANSKFDDKTVKALLTPALTSIVTGIVTKILTKKASYKAVEVFNGAVKKKVKDIFSVGAASSNMGIGVYVKL